MTTQEQLRDISGATAYDRDGDKLGKIGQVYFDDDTEQPKWITVHTGLFGTNESFVPLQGAEFNGDRVTVAYDKATVKDAPNVGDDQHLDAQEEQRLYQHYGLDHGAGNGRYEAGGVTDETAGRYGAGGVADDTSGRYGAGHLADDTAGRHELRDETATGVASDRGRDTSGPTTDQAMTRSEEHLRVGTENVETGRARLRKYVVTENVTQTVPVSREEVRVEREPITEANRGDAYDGPEISEEEHEVTLHAERPVASKEAEAVERVRLGTETVTEQEEVGGEVRKERIETDGVDERSAGGRVDETGTREYRR